MAGKCWRNVVDLEMNRLHLDLYHWLAENRPCGLREKKVVLIQNLEENPATGVLFLRLNLLQPIRLLFVSDCVPHSLNDCHSIDAH